MRPTPFSEIYPYESEQVVQTSSIEESFEAFWRGLPEHITGRRSEEDKQHMFAREVLFIDKVYSAATRLAAERDGPITVLFDVDETLVRNEYGEENAVTTHVRPGFGVLVRALDEALGDRIDIGLLTSRAQSHLDEELASPTYTQATVGKLNPEFVVSSRDGNLLKTHEALTGVPRHMMSTSEKRALDAIRNIADPVLAAVIEANDIGGILQRVDRAHWYDAKLAILQVLAGDYPERGFVFVDDLPFPAVIDPSHPQVRGVALSDASFRLH